MNPTAAALLALSAATLVAAGTLFQDSSAAPVWVQSELEALALRIQGEIEALRGQRFDGPVPVKVADRETLLAYMKKRTEEMEPAAKVAADERVAKLLGVIPPEMDLLATAYKLLEDQVAGFYDPPTKTFYLMDAMPKGLAGPTLAHELVHALDDQLYDLDGSMEPIKDDSDQLQAYRFVVEGSGTVGMNQWTMRNMGEVSLDGTEQMMEKQAALTEAPEWLWMPLLGAYMQGSAFLTRSDDVMASQLKEVDAKDIERAFRERPLSTEQVLHPEKYWDPKQRDDPRKVRFTVGELPEGWSTLREDTLGELGLALVLDAGKEGQAIDMKNPLTILGIKYTNELAAGWDADHVILLGKGDESWMRLVTVWDSERDAGEFYAGMRAVLPRIEDAADALGGEDTHSGAELVYGKDSVEVVLTVWSGIKRRRDQRGLEDAVTYAVQ